MDKTTSTLSMIAVQWLLVRHHDSSVRACTGIHWGFNASILRELANLPAGCCVPCETSTAEKGCSKCFFFKNRCVVEYKTIPRMLWRSSHANALEMPGELIIVKSEKPRTTVSTDLPYVPPEYFLNAAAHIFVPTKAIAFINFWVICKEWKKAVKQVTSPSRVHLTGFVVHERGSTGEMPAHEWLLAQRGLDLPPRALELRANHSNKLFFMIDIYGPSLCMVYIEFSSRKGVPTPTTMRSVPTHFEDFSHKMCPNRMIVFC